MELLGRHPMEGGESVKTMKRKFKKIMNVISSCTAKVKPTIPPFSFEDEDLLDRNPNKWIMLLIQTVWPISTLEGFWLTKGPRLKLSTSSCLTHRGSRWRISPHIMGRICRDSMVLKSVRTQKFHGFFLTEWGILDNSDKCRSIIEMRPPKKKEIRKPRRMMVALSHSIRKRLIELSHSLDCLRK